MTAFATPYMLGFLLDDEPPKKGKKSQGMDIDSMYNSMMSNITDGGGMGMGSGTDDIYSNVLGSMSGYFDVERQPAPKQTQRLKQSTAMDGSAYSNLMDKIWNWGDEPERRETKSRSSHVVRIKIEGPHRSSKSKNNSRQVDYDEDLIKGKVLRKIKHNGKYREVFNAGANYGIYLNEVERHDAVERHQPRKFGQRVSYAAGDALYKGGKKIGAKLSSRFKKIGKREVTFAEGQE